jgi:hypothetical protein
MLSISLPGQEQYTRLKNCMKHLSKLASTVKKVKVKDKVVPVLN